jgi:hypothetical protein
MKQKIFSLFLLVLFMASGPSNSKEYTSPTFSFTYNILQTAAFLASNKIFIKPDLTYIPLHVDAQLKLHDRVGVSFGLVYRYENYHDKGPLYSENSGRVRSKKIWTNYHEIFLLAGPRFSLSHTGLEGFYFSLKAGLGTAFSPIYWNLSIVAQPEFGYNFVFNNPGFNLNLGLGLLANLPVYENITFVVPWRQKSTRLPPLGVIVHQVIPVLNIGLGFSI